eukprot:831821-Prymnesium_polylepis.2
MHIRVASATSRANQTGILTSQGARMANTTSAVCARAPRALTTRPSLYQPLLCPPPRHPFCEQLRRVCCVVPGQATAPGLRRDRLRHIRSVEGAIRSRAFIVALVALPSVKCLLELVVPGWRPLGVHALRRLHRSGWRQHQRGLVSPVGRDAVLARAAQVELCLERDVWVDQVSAGVGPAAACARSTRLFSEDCLVPGDDCPVHRAPGDGERLGSRPDPQHTHIEHVARLVTRCYNVASQSCDRWQRIRHKAPIGVDEQHVPPMRSKMMQSVSF